MPKLKTNRAAKKRYSYTAKDNVKRVLDDLETQKHSEAFLLNREYDDRIKQADDVFKEWADAKEKGFANRFQERKDRFENEKKECGNSGDLDLYETNYHKIMRDYNKVLDLVSGNKPLWADMGKRYQRKSLLLLVTQVSQGSL